MVALEQIQASNAKIAETYPEGLVAVFAGATAGIGETSLREFARHAAKPRIYIIGRSKEACDRLDADLKSVNSAGEYTFVRSDLSLLRNVDDVCRDIRSKESAINVLFMSQGSLNLKKGKMDPRHQYCLTMQLSRRRVDYEMCVVVLTYISLQRPTRGSTMYLVSHTWDVFAVSSLFLSQRLRYTLHCELRLDGNLI